MPELTHSVTDASFEHAAEPIDQLEATVTLARPSDNKPSDDDVLGFLRIHHGEEPRNLEVLGGGFWSAAYGYRIGDDELVLRLNDEPGGFRDDLVAMRYASAALPVPEVFTVDEAFGRWFAISRRHHGRFLEEVGPEEAEELGPTVVDLLAGLRAVPDSGAATPPWRDWLLDGISDRPGHHTSGWRRRLAQDPAADRTFRAVDRRIRSLIEACADRRQLVHSDLLHYNVLVTPEADAVSAVFSWKCSTWGDALYDLSWCTFWGRWHDGIAALGLWDRVIPTLPKSDSTDVAVRHHVYELQIGANHLGWYATLGDTDNLRWTARQLDELLERGPLRPPSDR